MPGDDLATAATLSARSIARSALTACGLTLTAAPISPKAAAASNTSAVMPKVRSACAAASPASPPPTIAILQLDGIRCTIQFWRLRGEGTVGSNAALHGHCDLPRETEGAGQVQDDFRDEGQDQEHCHDGCEKRHQRPHQLLHRQAADSHADEQAEPDRRRDMADCGSDHADHAEMDRMHAHGAGHR